MPEEQVSFKDNLEVLQAIRLDDGTEQEKVDALWRQLMVYKSFGDSDLSDAKSRRAQAESAREQAQMEAIRTTQLLCARMRTEAELELQETKKAKMEAEKNRQYAEEELREAKERRDQADTERLQIIAEAQKKAQSIIEGAHDIAKRETTELRRHALKEIKGVLGRVDSMRSLADEEVETQKILSNISKIKATSRWLLNAPAEQVVEHLGSKSGLQNYWGTHPNEVYAGDPRPVASASAPSEASRPKASASNSGSRPKPAAASRPKASAPAAKKSPSKPASRSSNGRASSSRPSSSRSRR
ncbi:MAG: hypothetical protein J4N64_00720 [Chloroflexi bacterium]|nr:hypothetical protein [Chloroflexota bacterium]MCI0840264.1 hypothetical protein [Chloroflexota bacterium]